MTAEREQELLKKLADAVINYDEDTAREGANEAIAEGMDPRKAIFDGLVVGMQECGRLYEIQEYFVPELLMCADAMYAGLDLLRPLLKKDESKPRGQVVMGVVQGDVHDIGKNIVKMMFDAAGFTVHDLGRDVPLEKFVEEQLRTDSEIVALSAMMTTTMLGMRSIIKMIRERNPKAKIMIGGAPVSEQVASMFGADGYAKDATNALKDAIAIISSLKDM